LRLRRKFPIVAYRLKIPWPRRVQENAEPDEKRDGTNAGEDERKRRHR
jgi:hypothetical protein